MAGEGGERERLNESDSRRGHNNMDFKGLALQSANQLRRFVGGNPAGDTHRDTHGSIVERFEV